MAEEHSHCISCVNRRCMIRPQPGVSCDLTCCPLFCGAVFHSCKAEEHHLLCPLLRVPCLNRAYGCPAAMARNQMSAHLEVCPAGVMFCGMEWNHCAVSDTDDDYSYKRLRHAVEVEQLGIAVALKDKCSLLESLGMISIVPTIQRGLFNLTIQFGSLTEPGLSALSDSRPEPARERIANGIHGLNEQDHPKLYKTTLKKPRSFVIAWELVRGANSSDCCAEGAESRLDKLQNGQTADKAMEEHSLTNGCLEMVVQEDLVASQDVAMSSLHNGKEVAQKNIVDLFSGANSASSPADGVETSQQASIQVQFQNRLTADKSMEETSLLINGCLEIDAPQDVMMSPLRAHVVLEDGESEEWMLSTGQSPSASQSQSKNKAVDTSDLEQDVKDAVMEESSRDCTACIRISDTLPLVYGRIHSGTKTFPFPVTLMVTHTAPHVVLEDREPEEWLLPTGQSPSTSQGQSETKTEDKAVDTSDLQQDDYDTVDFCQHESFRACTVHIRSRMDGDRIYFGTKTFSLQVDMLDSDTGVGDMASASACDKDSPQNACPISIHTVRHSLGPDPLLGNCYKFPFACDQSFRRDEFTSHYANVHRDIYDGVNNGWMEHRCPLAFYGCTFSQRRFYPTSPGAKVVHDRHLRSFGVQPHPGAKLSGDSHADQFSGLPNEVLCHIVGFLDSFSLCQLSLVSRNMREVCYNLLQTRGIVELQWEKRLCFRDTWRVSWQVKRKMWRFSTAFSPVLTWGFADVPSMSNHLKQCQYNTVEHRTEPVPLTVGLGPKHLNKLPKSQRPVDF
ncbi:F-box only protein 30b isoform X2 [Festucalex cinctus]